MWPFKNKAREAVERRLEEWIPVRSDELPDDEPLGIPVFCDENGRLYPKPLPQHDPYHWHSVADMVGR